MTDEATGWVKPQRKRSLPELLELISSKREELQVLENEAASLQRDARLNAIAQARNIMRAHQLTLPELLQDSGDDVSRSRARRR